MSAGPHTDNPSSYEADFYAWTQDQAARLRAAQAACVTLDLDWDHLAEELESMGSSERSEIESRLLPLLFHLAKLAWSLDQAPRRGWRVTVIEQRRRLASRLNKSPSLGDYPAEIMAETWDLARQKAEVALNLADETLPTTCPWELSKQILNEQWWPEPPAH